MDWFFFLVYRLLRRVELHVELDGVDTAPISVIGKLLRIREAWQRNPQRMDNRAFVIPGKLSNTLVFYMKLLGEFFAFREIKFRNEIALMNMFVLCAYVLDSENTDWFFLSWETGYTQAREAMLMEMQSIDSSNHLQRDCVPWVLWVASSLDTFYVKTPIRTIERQVPIWIKPLFCVSLTNDISLYIFYDFSTKLSGSYKWLNFLFTALTAERSNISKTVICFSFTYRWFFFLRFHDFSNKLRCSSIGLVLNCREMSSNLRYINYW